jgi:hypothetical protein
VAGDFVGTVELKRLQNETLNNFEGWCSRGDWASFHLNHCDWWAFPINKPSSFGDKYKLNNAVIRDLKSDMEFLSKLERSAELLLLSWGWDLKLGGLVPNPGHYQSWADWPIRLAKCRASLKLFERTQQVEGIDLFVRYLVSEGKSFEYRGRDLLIELKL